MASPGRSNGSLLRNVGLWLGADHRNAAPVATVLGVACTVFGDRPHVGVPGRGESGYCGPRKVSPVARWYAVPFLPALCRWICCGLKKIARRT